jgi:hypothetical protein
MTKANDKQAMGQINNVTNLYDEDGITIGLTADYDICDPSDDDCSILVVGHPAYVGSLDEAQRSIRDEYMRRNHIID